MVVLTTGERIGDLISNKGVTKAATEMGVTPSHLSNIVHDKMKKDGPGSETLKKICRHYNVSADYLLGLSEVRSLNQTTQSIHRATGLSEGAIENLRSLKKSDTSLAFINALLEDKAALYAFSSLIDDIVSGEKSGEVYTENEYRGNLARYVECVDILRKLVSNLTEEV